MTVYTVKAYAGKWVVEGAGYRSGTLASQAEASCWAQDLTNAYRAGVGQGRAALAAEIRPRVVDAVSFVREYVDDSGGCDHPVGVCVCEAIRTADVLAAAVGVAGVTPEYEDPGPVPGFCIHGIAATPAECSARHGKEVC